MNDPHGDERLALIAEGATLSLEQAVREFLRVADDLLLDSGGKPRPPEAHGGAFMSRWRFHRLRAAFDAHVRGAVAPPGAEPNALSHNERMELIEETVRACGRAAIQDPTDPQSDTLPPAVWSLNYGAILAAVERRLVGASLSRETPEQ